LLDKLPDTPGGHNLALKPGHDSGLELASRQHLRNLHAAFVLAATINRNEQILTGDPAKQRACEPFICNPPPAELKEHPSVA
jgi:hypothetical protein